MATFIDRVLQLSDYETDGGYIERSILADVLHMYVGGAVNSAYVKTYFALTTSQAAGLDEILATQPAALLTVLNAVARAAWVDKVVGILSMGQRGADFVTVSAQRSALGLSP